MLLLLLSILGTASVLLKLYSRHATSSTLPLAVTPWSKPTLSATITYRLGRHTGLSQTWTGLRIHTTKLNRPHDLLLERINRNAWLQTSLRGFYDLGAYVALVGMVASVAIMLWSALQLLLSFNRTPLDGNSGFVSPTLLKRAMDLSTVDSQSNSILRPIVSSCPLSTGIILIKSCTTDSRPYRTALSCSDPFYRASLLSACT